MILIFKNPENFEYISGFNYQVRQTYIGCENCPNCYYYVGSDGTSFKVKNCRKHKKQ